MTAKPPSVNARLRVRLTPRAAQDEIAGWQGDVLRVRVTAPPVDGRANAALERLLAQALGLPKRAVRVVSGTRVREKTVAIEGAARREVLSRLSEGLGEGLGEGPRSEGGSS